MRRSKAESSEPFEFPDWELPSSPPPVPPVSETVRSHARRLKHLARPRILVVDDEPGVSLFVERVLTDARYAVVAVPDAAHALRALESGGQFDLIVTDVRMPAMSGPQLIDRIRSMRIAARVPVLYLTAYNDQLFHERMALSPSEAFLDKPCTVRGLLEAVSLLLWGHVQPAESASHTP